MKVKFTYKGGHGSGHHGHAGRPGKVGGSLPQGSHIADISSKYPKSNPTGKDTFEQYMTKDNTWTRERQLLHEEIKKEFFKGKTPVENPVSYMMGGGPAAGKSTILNSGLESVPENAVLAAGDDIKKMLPEYIHGEPSDPNRAAFVHEESSWLAKQIMDEASSKGYNVILDGTGDSNMDKLKRKVERMSKGGQKVHGIYVTVDTEVAVQRNYARYKVTGRMVPPAVVRAGHAGVSRIFEPLVKSGIMDSVKLYDTNGSKPVLVAEAQGSKFSIYNEDLYKRFLDKAK